MEKSVYTIQYTDFGINNAYANGDTKEVEVVASSYEWAIQLFRLQLPKSLKYTINYVYISEVKLVAIQND